MLRKHFFLSLAWFAISPIHAVLAQSTPPAVREIDNHAGIFFFCKPLASEAWTARACEETGARMAELASAVQKPVVILKARDTRETYPRLAKAKGFDSTRAIWFLLTIDPHAQLKGQWELTARVDHSKIPPPVSGQPQVVTSSMRATVDASADVSARGKAMLDTLMLTLARPGWPQQK
jgi:hypothetical protein